MKMKQKILLVVHNENKGYVKVLSSVIRKYGEISVLYGKQDFAKLDLLGVEILLIDSSLVVDPFQECKEIRKDYQNIGIVFLTTTPDWEWVRQVLPIANYMVMSSSIKKVEQEFIATTSVKYNQNIEKLTRKKHET